MLIEKPASKKSLRQRKLVHGVGINDAPYIVRPIASGKTKICPYYSVWSHMIERCYSERELSRNPSYIGCSVAKEWHSFMSFRLWMENQDWKGKQLDKDVLIVGNKIYSPETCIFVTRQVNTLLTYVQSSRGEYPTGVCFYKRGNNFEAQCSVKGKRKYLGRYSTPEEAETVYKTAKANEIARVAKLQTNGRISYSLHLHALYLKNGAAA